MFLWQTVDSMTIGRLIKWHLTKSHLVLTNWRSTESRFTHESLIKRRLTNRFSAKSRWTNWRSTKSRLTYEILTKSHLTKRLFAKSRWTNGRFCWESISLVSLKRDHCLVMEELATVLRSKVIVDRLTTVNGRLLGRRLLRGLEFKSRRSERFTIVLKIAYFRLSRSECWNWIKMWNRLKMSCYIKLLGKNVSTRFPLSNE